MTHTHDGFQCSSPRDYLDTKSYLDYEQNPYSTHKVKSGSCHRVTSQGYDISLLSLSYKLRWISDFFSMRQHLDGLISGATQPYHSQYNPWVAAPSPAWLGSTIISMTQHLHCATIKSPWQHHHRHDLAALSPAWLGINIASWPSPPAAPSPAWLRIYITLWPSSPGSAVTSMTRHLHHATAKSPL
jgi:hypothetical protein